MSYEEVLRKAQDDNAALEQIRKIMKRWGDSDQWLYVLLEIEEVLKELENE